jgi:hypothetical protein
MEQQNTSSLFNEVNIDSQARQHIQTMGTWAMIVAVVAVIGYLFNIIGLFAVNKIELASEGFGNYLQKMTTGSSSVVSTVISVGIGLVVNYFLYRFSVQAKNGLAGVNQQLFSNSFRNLKNYFMITSVVVIIGFLFVLFSLLYVVFFAKDLFNQAF